MDSFANLERIKDPMGENTLIAWTEHTLNFWMGCTRVGPGCAHCYAETAMTRYGRDFSTVTRTKTWGDAFKWQRAAAAAGRTERVFTCSWSDFFHEKADPWREEAWAVIKSCPNLQFQILTKRADRIASCLPKDWGEGYPNAWLGVSVENPSFLSRVDILRKIPARVRFISAEPLLAPLPTLNLNGIHWLIVGGESGPGFRPMPHEWARELRDKAKASGTAFFFKQSAAPRTEMGTKLDGVEWKEYPAA